MSKFVAIFALAALCLVAVALADNVYTRAGHSHDMRKRLGHFKEKPFIDLYKFYATAFVLPNHSERKKDDYRNYMPSADECVLFLKQYRSQSFKLRDLDEMVVLDACLGYLYDEGAQEFDEERKELKQFTEFPELKNLYAGTQVNALSEDGKECVADLLINIIVAKNDYSDVVCNNHFLQVFLQFAECQVAIPAEARTSDTYLEVIYQLVRDRVHVCVDYEVGHINTAVREAYGKRKFSRLSNKIKSRFSSLAGQEEERMWPREVIRLLSAFQDTTDEVNIRDVHEIIRGVIEKDEKLEARLLSNMAKYADKEIAPMAKSKANKKDPKGMKRYSDMVDSLCNYFRASDQESRYDFATPIIRMNQLLAHEDLFGISQLEFVRKMLTRAKETAPIYLSVQACNILRYTEGIIAQPEANTQQHYNVMFSPDTTGMILWPDAGHY